MVTETLNLTLGREPLNYTAFHYLTQATRFSDTPRRDQISWLDWQLR